ncbi:hypothetical protein XELAEV_18011546mg [Xenopus laevis]|uniref:Uncharacterized protein n=1 Tax=Xenopus laevis TaxID=8355 RepID=A0A974HXK4_XENLA|nr:hypothetical protein XELAEV_18011546mg [Xenopus laevis]
MMCLVCLTGHRTVPSSKYWQLSCPVFGLSISPNCQLSHCANIFFLYSCPATPQICQFALLLPKLPIKSQTGHFSRGNFGGLQKTNRSECHPAGDLHSSRREAVLGDLSPRRRGNLSTGD